MEEKLLEAILNSYQRIEKDIQEIKKIILDAQNHSFRPNNFFSHLKKDGFDLDVCEIRKSIQTKIDKSINQIPKQKDSSFYKCEKPSEQNEALQGINILESPPNTDNVIPDFITIKKPVISSTQPIKKTNTRLYTQSSQGGKIKRASIIQEKRRDLLNGNVNDFFILLEKEVDEED